MLCRKMKGGRKRRCLVEKDISKVGFGMAVGLERRMELSETERGSGKLSRQKQCDKKTGRQEDEQKFGVNEWTILAKVDGFLGDKMGARWWPCVLD